MKRRLLAVVLLAAVLAAGCAAPSLPDALDPRAPSASAGAPTFPAAGEEADYRVRVHADPPLDVRVRYRWVGPEEAAARDGLGRAVPSQVVDVSLVQEGARRFPPVHVSRTTGSMVSVGHWQGEERAQDFATASAVWIGYPGLHRNASAGSDNLRAVFMPLLVLATRAAAAPEGVRVDELGVPVTMRRDAGGVVTAEHPDGARPTDVLRHALAYDRRSFFPSRIESSVVAPDGATRVLFELERTRHAPGSGTALSWTAADQPREVTLRSGASAAPFALFPVDGRHRLPFALADAVAVARGDPAVGAFLRAHPDAYLAIADYHSAPDNAAVAPTSPHATRTTRWSLEFWSPGGAGHAVTVLRKHLTSGERLADSVDGSFPVRAPGAYARSDLPSSVVDLGSALALAKEEAGIDAADHRLAVRWEVSRDDRLRASDHAATWEVQLREPLTIVPSAAVKLTASSGATVHRVAG